MDLTETEDIKKRWQEYTEELYKKELHDPDNHDGVITDLEPDILECEVKWALESITMNKASGGDGIPVELFQILKDDAVKVLHSICQQIWKSDHRVIIKGSQLSLKSHTLTGFFLLTPEPKQSSELIDWSYVTKGSRSVHEHPQQGIEERPPRVPGQNVCPPSSTAHPSLSRILSAAGQPKDSKGLKGDRI